MYGVGSIICAKNIIFKNVYGKDRKELDHAYKSGRPCLVICETNNNIYLLSILGYKGKEYVNEIKLPTSISNKPSCVNVRDIICKDIAYYKELSALSERQLYNILIKFVNYQENVKKDEFYDVIAENVKEKIEELVKNLSTKEKSKIKNKKSKNK